MLCAPFIYFLGSNGSDACGQVRTMMRTIRVFHIPSTIRVPVQKQCSHSSNEVLPLRHLAHKKCVTGTTINSQQLIVGSGVHFFNIETSCVRLPCENKTESLFQGLRYRKTVENEYLEGDFHVSCPSICHFCVVSVFPHARILAYGDHQRGYKGFGCFFGWPTILGLPC